MSGAWRALRVAQDMIYPPPEGWGDKLYVVVKPNPTQPTVQVADETSQFGGEMKHPLSHP